MKPFPMPEFAFLQLDDDTWAVGWGPFARAPHRLAGQTAFYVGDYFLRESAPWLHPARVERLSRAEFLERLPPAAPPRVEWSPLWAGTYFDLFSSARRAIEAGQFLKVVPILFEQGRLASSPREFLPYLARRAVDITSTVLRSYGFVSAERGFVGLSPETLFASTGTGFRTMALAGTRPLHLAWQLEADPKERSEHAMVTEDIVRRLEPLGPVQVGPLSVRLLPRIAHLERNITVTLPSDQTRPSFEEFVGALHPTAALGAWPRNAAASRWLRVADEGVARGIFGAPFGFEDEHECSLCLVAIRNLEWQGDRVRLGAGSGVILESRFDHEWRELRNKREQVKNLLGLESA
jgi:menaquinone-specific isochorismate synthase